MTIRPFLVNVTEAANLLCIGRTKAYDLIRTGDIPSVKIGKSIRVSLEALDQIANQSKFGQPTVAGRRA